MSLLATVIGCGSAPQGPEVYDVAGEVTFDGKPIETGRIEFQMPNGKAFGGDIKDGTYALQSEGGPMVVKITASRIIPGKFDTSNPDDPPQPVGEMFIPAKYNAKSELTAEVKPGKNSFPFTLMN
jgi:hypothetical protein